MPIVRWSARAISFVVAAMFLFLLGGEMFYPHAGPPSQLREWAGIGLLALVVAGMLLAYRWEAPGALFSLAALAIFVLAAGMRRYDEIAILAAPGILFLIDWGLRRTHRPHPR
ncbi:MAG: hypothetical protein LAO79_13420 [Acidobacteriia bacterium]|nr:hypothetical protein [Terriglobia bacterium]